MSSSLIPFNKPSFSKADLKSIATVIESEWVAEGPVSKAFESKLAELLGGGKSRVTSSGTAALYLAIKFLHLPANARIGIPSYACTALVDAISLARFEPFIIDIAKDSPNIDTDAVLNLPAALKPAAIIGVHCFGIPFKIPQNLNGIRIIEDCCHSIGGKIEGRYLGSQGDASVFSFYATKIITGGTGGLVFSKDIDLIDSIDRFLSPSWSNEQVPIFNFRSNDISSALSLSQLHRLEEIKNKRQVIYDVYENAVNDKSRLLYKRNGTDIMPYRFVLLADNSREQKSFLDYFHNLNIEANLLYRPGELLHRRLSLDPALFPNAERISQRTVALPLHMGLSRSNIERIQKAISGLS